MKNHGALAFCILTTTFLIGCDNRTTDVSYTAVNNEWHHHGGDHFSSKYAPFDQINLENFNQLEIAWRWQSADFRVPPDQLYPTGDYRATPLYVNGVIYTTTNHSQVAAIDPISGEELWVFDPESYKLGPPNFSPIQTRGIEYWADEEVERIFVATPGKQLVSIDIVTGLPDPEFGDDGFVDLKQNLGRLEFEMNNITHGAPPIAVGNSLIVGSKIYDYSMNNRSPPGHVRAYDTRTGEFKWRFNTIPQPGEEFNETWENGSWAVAGNTNVWTYMAADDDLGIVYLPTSTPTNDYWGGYRLGENLYAESIVALDAETGERIWHFQTVHHGLWDYDIASAPNLVDIVVDGKSIKAIAQVSKTGFTYVFDRITGEPVWPIEEVPVPPSTVPGERAHPTQPIPSKPPPFEQVGINEDDLIDFTPALRQEALEISEKFQLGDIFTPPIVQGTNGKSSTYVVPGAGGGANFPGASMDPETQTLYVPSVTRPTGMALVEPPDGTSDWPYVIRYDRSQGPQGLPLIKPPYRRITAINLNTGEHEWQVPLGKGPTDHPAIAHLKLGDLGSVFSDVVAEGGVLVTKSLVISYLAAKDEIGPEETGSILVAFDKTNGTKAGEVFVDQRLHGPIMSYQHDEIQYIAVAGGGRDNDAELLVFKLGNTP